MRSIHSISTGFLDFPGRYSVTLFFKGCNIRCPFCHNQEVVNGSGVMTIADVMQFVKRLNKSFMGGLGIVFSGGEPTADEVALTEAYQTFKDMPLCIHTNGIILPYWDNYFEAVVLSVKSPAVVNLPFPEYAKVLFDAMDYYNDCEIKQLRYVRGTVPTEFIDSIMDIFHDNGWDVVSEQDTNEKGGV